MFAFTAYASAPVFLNALLIFPAALLLLPLQASPAKASKSKSKTVSKETGGAIHQNGKEGSRPKQGELHKGSLIVRPFLTFYRGSMLVATTLAILAVDFPIFPRRFAKVETWGTSLMDLGVGSFVFSAGVVSARAVLREQQLLAESKKEQYAIGIAGRIIKACRHSIPLLVLGLIRLISVKNLDYAEHVTEYGVHWNFFFTLALLPPFVEAVDCLLALVTPASVPSPSASSSESSRTITSPSRLSERSVRYDVIALFIILTYELLLNNTNLLSFILISPRTPTSSLLAKNREGVFSFFGYLAIFLSGRSTGILVCQFQLTKAKSATVLPKGTSTQRIEASKIHEERRKVIIPLLALRAITYSTLYWSTSSVYILNLTVSRRLANLPYVLWIIAFNDAQLLLFALIEAVGPSYTFSTTKSSIEDDTNIQPASEIASKIMTAFNKNGLVIFLIANLLTGLVNLSINTLDMGNTSAMGVLLVYAAIVTGVAVGLDYAKLHIKI